MAERCGTPPMRTLIQLGGPNMGQFGIPNCNRAFSAQRCDLIRRAVSELVYTE